MHNEALTPNAPDPTPSRKVTPARALAIVSPDPQDSGAARNTRAGNDTAQARSTRDSERANTAPHRGESGFASTRARTSAVFLTQLIACSRRLPAYRERRRAAPDEAARAYGATSAPQGRQARIISEF